jgi:hypothetical protein
MDPITIFLLSTSFAKNDLFSIYNLLRLIKIKILSLLYNKLINLFRRNVN